MPNKTVWTIGTGGTLMLNGKNAPLIKGVVYSPHAHRREL